MEFEVISKKYESYLMDESRLSGQGDYIVFPKDTQALSAALRQARELGLSVTIQGGRTGIAGGAVPKGGLIVSLEKMDRILSIETSQEYYGLRVEPGLTRESLLHFLLRAAPPDEWDKEQANMLLEMKNKGRYFFPPNPTEASATLGGMFATNARGMNSFRFGGTAEHISALTWICWDGSAWKIQRGEYVFNDRGLTLPNGKNISLLNRTKPVIAALNAQKGMDLIDFLGGSEGLLGVAAELVLTIRPVPTNGWGVVYFFESPHDALALTQIIQDRYNSTDDKSVLSAWDYYDANVLKLIRDNQKTMPALAEIPEIPQGIQAAIYCEMEGNDEENLEAVLMEHMNCFLETGGREENTWAAGSLTEMERFRILRHGIPELINNEVDKIRQNFRAFHKTAVDFQWPVTCVEDTFTRYHEDLAKSGIKGFIFGHIFENRLHVNFLAHNTEEIKAIQELMMDWAHGLVQKDGIIGAENGIGKIKRDLAVPLCSPERKNHIMRVLEAFGVEKEFI